MIDQYENIESLKNLVLGCRMPFIQKIYHLISYSKYHHDERNKIGIFWADSKEIMLVNSSILGNFIDLKPNSVNKNLKSYGILKQKASQISFAGLLELVDRHKWLFRKSSFYAFNVNTSFNEIRNYKPSFNMPKNVLQSPPVETKSELINNIKIASIALLSNRDSDWESTFRTKFSKHWFDIAELNNVVSIRNVMEFLKKDQKEIFTSNLQIENKILDVLHFFSNNNDEFIDIDDYFVFCSFFGVGGAIVQNVEKFPLKKDEVCYNNSNLENNWIKMIKCDQSLLKLMENQNNETWVFCFSSEPGIYLLLRKNDCCILQTQIFFDVIDNSYSIGTSFEGVKKFAHINELIFSFLKFDLGNLLSTRFTPSVISVPADFLHLNFQKKNGFDEDIKMDDDKVDLFDF